MLVQRGYPSRATDHESSTFQALLATCIVGDIKMIQLLHDQADPWCLEQNGPNPMTQAIKASQSAAVYELLCIGIKPDDGSLLAAVQGGYTELFTLLRTRIKVARWEKPFYDEVLIGATVRGY
jgi:hypothetical protein